MSASATAAAEAAGVYMCMPACMCIWVCVRVCVLMLRLLCSYVNCAQRALQVEAVTALRHAEYTRNLQAAAISAISYVSFHIYIFTVVNTIQLFSFINSALNKNRYIC